MKDPKAYLLALLLLARNPDPTQPWRCIQGSPAAEVGAVATAPTKAQTSSGTSKRSTKRGRKSSRPK